MKSAASLALACTLILWPIGGGCAFAAQDAAAPGAHAQHPAEDAAGQVAGGAAAPAQQAAAPGQAAPVQAAPQQQGGLVPVSQVDAPMFSIPDIRAHRGHELSYVRRVGDRVEPDLTGLDLSADPIMTLGSGPVSRNQYRRRALMYGGGNEVDKHVTHLITQQEIERQVADFTGALAADDPERDAKVDAFRLTFKLDDTAIDRKFEEYKELLRQQARQGAVINPGDPDPADSAIAEFEESIRTSIGMDAYRQLLAADAAFEKVFLPFPEGTVEGETHDMSIGPPPMDEPRPDWMPQVSWDALGMDEQGRNLRSFVKSWAVDGSGIPGLFKPSILARVREGLVAQIGVSFFFDEELPDDIFMKVGGQLVPVDDLWYLVDNKLTDADNELIVRELLTLTGMKLGLTAAGKWLDQEAFAAIWHAHEQEYVGTLFPLRNIILFRGYTSLDRYREHYRYRQAYNLWRKAALTDEEVLEHYQGGGRLFFERGNIVVDIAFAELGSRPFNNGTLDATDAELRGYMDQAMADWQAERSRAVVAAEAAAAQGAAGGTEAAVAAAVSAASAAVVAADEATNGPGNAAWFARVARQHAAPPSPQGGDNHNFQRSQLRMRMAEDELSIFLTGYSLADDVYYHGQRGDVYGPWAERCRQHAWGAEANAGSWAVSVKDFNRGGPVGAFEGRNKDLAYEDFLDLNYFNWAQESLKAQLPAMKIAKADAAAK